MKKLRLISSVLVTVLAIGLYSCDNGDGVEPSLDDESLIVAIESASNRIPVESSDLPSSSLAVISSDFSESIVASAEMAPDLGFTVTLLRESGARVGEQSSAFFDLNGRELRSDRRERFRQRRRQARDCFDFVFPVSLTVPDGTELTIEDGNDWGQVREWYQANPDERARPEFIFPLDITFGDSTVTVDNNMDLFRARGACEVDRSNSRCFDFVFPITFIMADDSEIELGSNEDWHLIRAWYVANPDAETKPDLVFPVQITLEDGTVVTVDSEEELENQRQGCRD
ncbi:hypothetical protein [Roseivirga misakiensis]|uniref:Uncharacterized protein n=1 Tax=Roseivirga misakiensis TaxID=1563681 RepID=A0A1E5T1Y6_9BACT|nr:hypothetical protein [Roseivirga misakiensis]OEK05385.1 hypothetical protein BFP71_18515 [Roseivirga misakiensis]